MTNEQLFHGVRYYLSKSLPLQQRNQLSQVLSLNGGQAVDLDNESLTHYVSNALPGSDSLESLPETSTALSVTPLWVERSLVLSATQEAVFYSPDPTMLFSGVVATSCDLSAADNEVLSAGISSLGGQWRTALTKDVTHLFALSSGSHKYETAIHFRDATGMKVLAPHWFDDVVRLGVRGVPTDDYEWPDVKVFKTFGLDGAQSQEGIDEARENKKSRPLTPHRKALYDTALSQGMNLPAQRAESSNVWNGLSFVFGSSLEFNDSQKAAHAAEIVRGGGTVLDWDSPDDELEKIDRADVYIARFRSGQAFVRAYRRSKTIGTLPWLWYVRATGTLTRPSDQLLHYPIPKRPVENFSRHIITITNYTGKDREYIKKLILTMGADFTPSMSGKNTIVIAAYISGIKTTKAIAWGIPVVNHLWIEECFAQWRDVSPANDKYIKFPPNVDFGTLLAEDRGLGAGRVGYDQAELDAMEREVEEEEQTTGSQRRKSILKRTPSLGARNSMTSIRSTEEVENFMLDRDGDVRMDTLGDISTGGYQDIDIPLDEEGRLSMSGSLEKIQGGAVEADEDESRNARKPRTPAKLSAKPTPSKGSSSKPVTPARGRGRPRKSVTPARATSSSKATGKSRLEVEVDDGDEDDAESVESSPIRPKSKLVRRVTGAAAKPEGRRDLSDYELGPSAQRGSVIKTYGARSRSRSRSRPAVDKEAADLDKRTPKTSLKTYRSKAKDAAVEIGDGDDDVALRRSARTKTPQKPSSSSVRRRHLPQIPTDSESEEEDRGRPSTRTQLTKKLSRTSLAGNTDTEAPIDAATRTPRKQVSVIVPTLAVARSSSKKRLAANNDDAAPEDRADQAIARKSETTPRTESVLVQASNAAKPAAKRGRPPKKKSIPQASKPKTPSPARSPSPATSHMPPPKTKPERRPTVSTPEPGPSHAPEVPASLTRTPSKRSAASKATQKLHEIMPDALNFQKELKNGNIKSAYDVQQESARKLKALEKNSKKRRSLNTEDGEPSNDQPDKKRRKTSREDVGDGVGQTRNQPQENGGTLDKTALSSAAGSRIIVMTTQVTLSEDVIKAFVKLGGSFATKPAECTHLVTRSLVRTEKFLCAMSRAPVVVTDKWVETCVSQKKILPTADFILNDPVNEKKYGFKLADALQRARANNGKLFQGKTFYVTPKVPVDFKLLKNVVTAGGGQILSQAPTVRILKASVNRVVISSSADASIWRPLSENGFTIYTQELILTGMLKQQIDWDDDANKVPGSF